METVTFPQEEVERLVSDEVVPLRLPHDHEPLAKEFGVTWTPTLVVVDSEGKEHHRSVGFLTPEELMAFVLIGIGKTYFDKGLFDQASEAFRMVAQEYAATGSAPEAIFMEAVSRFKSGSEPSVLKRAYEKLKNQYPDSEWTKRAMPYRLL